MCGWVGDWVSWLLQKGVHHHKAVEVAKNLRFLAGEGTGFGGQDGGGGALVAYVRGTSERARGLVFLGPFRRLRPTLPREVSGIPSTPEMREGRPRAGATAHGGHRARNGWKLRPGRRRGPAQGLQACRLVTRRTGRTAASQSHAGGARGPAGGPGRTLPAPRKRASAAGSSSPAGRAQLPPRQNVPPLFPGAPGPRAAQESDRPWKEGEVSASFH